MDLFCFTETRRYPQMANKKMDAKELSKLYDEVSEDSGKFKEMIEKNAMDPEILDWVIGGFFDPGQRYPELSSGEGMTAKDYAELYKKMSAEVKKLPDKYEEHAKPLGMTADQLSGMFDRISGGVEKYPEVWESLEKAQILHPRNLAMLATAFRESTAEALSKIRGIDEK